MGRYLLIFILLVSCSHLPSQHQIVSDDSVVSRGDNKQAGKSDTIYLPSDPIPKTKQSPKHRLRIQNSPLQPSAITDDDWPVPAGGWFFSEAYSNVLATYQVNDISAIVNQQIADIVQETLRRINLALQDRFCRYMTNNGRDGSPVNYFENQFIKMIDRVLRGGNQPPWGNVAMLTIFRTLWQDPDEDINPFQYILHQENFNRLLFNIMRGHVDEARDLTTIFTDMVLYYFRNPPVDAQGRHWYDRWGEMIATRIGVIRGWTPELIKSFGALFAAELMQMDMAQFLLGVNYILNTIDIPTIRGNITINQFFTRANVFHQTFIETTRRFIAAMRESGAMGGVVQDMFVQFDRAAVLARYALAEQGHFSNGEVQAFSQETEHSQEYMNMRALQKQLTEQYRAKIKKEWGKSIAREKAENSNPLQKIFKNLQEGVDNGSITPEEAKNMAYQFRDAMEKSGGRMTKDEIELNDLSKDEIEIPDFVKKLSPADDKGLPISDNSNLPTPNRNVDINIANRGTGGRAAAEAEAVQTNPFENFNPNIYELDLAREIAGCDVGAILKGVGCAADLILNVAFGIWQFIDYWKLSHELQRLWAETIHNWNILEDNMFDNIAELFTPTLMEASMTGNVYCPLPVNQHLSYSVKFVKPSVEFMRFDKQQEKDIPETAINQKDTLRINSPLCNVSGAIFGNNNAIGYVFYDDTDTLGTYVDALNNQIAGYWDTRTREFVKSWKFLEHMIIADCTNITNTDYKNTNEKFWGPDCKAHLSYVDKASGTSYLLACKTWPDNTDEEMSAHAALGEATCKYDEHQRHHDECEFEFMPHNMIDLVYDKFTMYPAMYGKEILRNDSLLPDNIDSFQPINNQMKLIPGATHMDTVVCFNIPRDNRYANHLYVKKDGLWRPLWDYYHTMKSDGKTRDPIYSNTCDKFIAKSKEWYNKDNVKYEDYKGQKGFAFLLPSSGIQEITAPIPWLDSLAVDSLYALQMDKQIVTFNDSTNNGGITLGIKNKNADIQNNLHLKKTDFDSYYSYQFTGQYLDGDSIVYDTLLVKNSEMNAFQRFMKVENFILPADPKVRIYSERVLKNGEKTDTIAIDGYFPTDSLLNLWNTTCLPYGWFASDSTHKVFHDDHIEPNWHAVALSINITPDDPVNEIDIPNISVTVPYRVYDKDGHLIVDTKQAFGLDYKTFIQVPIDFKEVSPGKRVPIDSCTVTASYGYNTGIERQFCFTTNKFNENLTDTSLVNVLWMPPGTISYYKEQTDGLAGYPGEKPIPLGPLMVYSRFDGTQTVKLDTAIYNTYNIPSMRIDTKDTTLLAGCNLAKGDLEMHIEWDLFKPDTLYLQRDLNSDQKYYVENAQPGYHVLKYEQIKTKKEKWGNMEIFGSPKEKPYDPQLPCYITSCYVCWWHPMMSFAPSVNRSYTFEKYCPKCGNKRNMWNIATQWELNPVDLGTVPWSNDYLSDTTSGLYARNLENVHDSIVEYCVDDPIVWRGYTYYDIGTDAYVTLFRQEGDTIISHTNAFIEKRFTDFKNADYVVVDGQRITDLMKDYPYQMEYSTYNMIGFAYSNPLKNCPRNLKPVQVYIPVAEIDSLIDYVNWFKTGIDSIKGKYDYDQKGYDLLVGEKPDRGRAGLVYHRQLDNIWDHDLFPCDGWDYCSGYGDTHEVNAPSSTCPAADSISYTNHLDPRGVMAYRLIDNDTTCDFSIPDPINAFNKASMKVTLPYREWKDDKIIVNSSQQLNVIFGRQTLATDYIRQADGSLAPDLYVDVTVTDYKHNKPIKSIDISVNPEDSVNHFDEDSCILTLPWRLENDMGIVYIDSSQVIQLQKQDTVFDVPIIFNKLDYDYYPTVWAHVELKISYMDDDLIIYFKDNDCSSLENLRVQSPNIDYDINHSNRQDWSRWTSDHFVSNSGDFPGAGRKSISQPYFFIFHKFDINTARKIRAYKDDKDIDIPHCFKNQDLTIDSAELTVAPSLPVFYIPLTEPGEKLKEIIDMDAIWTTTIFDEVNNTDQVIEKLELFGDWMTGKNPTSYYLSKNQRRKYSLQINGGHYKNSNNQVKLIKPTFYE